MARRSVDANFINVPAKLSDEEKLMLVDDLQRGGDSEIRHQGQVTTRRSLLIESHIDFIISIAIRYDYPDIHELVSEGLLTLTRSVDRFISGDLENTNISGYINVAVHRAIQRFICDDAIIPVKPDAYRKGVRTAVRSGFAHITKTTPDATPAVDVRDALAHVTKTPNQKIVAKCMLDGGYKLKDMAKLCNLSVPRVSQIKRGLTVRFQEVWDV